MSAHSRFTALREVVRAAARAAEGESATAVGLDRLCAQARQRGVPERLLRPSLVIAARSWSDETLPLTLSRQLAVSEGTARWRVYKARQVLFASLKQYLDVEPTVAVDRVLNPGKLGLPVWKSASPTKGDAVNSSTRRRKSLSRADRPPG